MKYLLATMTASLLTLAFAANAPAQTIAAPYYGVPSGYVQPYQAVVPAPIYAPAPVAAGLTIRTPSIGLGINFGPTYVPSVPVYPRPLYVPSYYPARYGYGYPHYNHYHR